jgi:hypothetical protein
MRTYKYIQKYISNDSIADNSKQPVIPHPQRHTPGHFITTLMNGLVRSRHGMDKKTNGSLCRSPVTIVLIAATQGGTVHSQIQRQKGPSSLHLKAGIRGQGLQGDLPRPYLLKKKIKSTKNP